MTQPTIIYVYRSLSLAHLPQKVGGHGAEGVQGTLIDVEHIAKFLTAVGVSLCAALVCSDLALPKGTGQQRRLGGESHTDGTGQERDDKGSAHGFDLSSLFGLGRLKEGLLLLAACFSPVYMNACGGGVYVVSVCVSVDISSSVCVCE